MLDFQEQVIPATLHKIIYPVLSLAEKGDFSNFKTDAKKLEKHIGDQFDKDGGEEIAIDLLELMKNIDLVNQSQQMERKIVRAIKAKRKVKDMPELYRLLIDADSRIPCSPLTLLFRQDPIEQLVKVLHPYDLMQSARYLRGEKLARHAVRVFREVAECAYIDYLRFVWGLLSLKNGETRFRIPKYGVLIAALPNRLAKEGYDISIETNSSFIRNAACHSDWHYDPVKKVISFFSRKADKLEIPPAELLALSKKMYNIFTEVYLPAISLYFSKKISTDWIGGLQHIQKNIVEVISGSNIEDPNSRLLVDQAVDAFKTIQIEHE